MPATEKSAIAEIAESEIKNQGIIPFSRFMHLWLVGTSDVPGYYASSPNIGFSFDSKVASSMDFYTSPELTPLFGYLLAKQVRQMQIRLGSSIDKFHIYEMGAGNGTLAKDIMYGMQMYHPRFNSIFKLGWGPVNSQDLYSAIEAAQKVDPSFEPYLKKPPFIPEYLEDIQYNIVEASPFLIEKQKETLKGYPVQFNLNSAMDLKNVPSYPGVVITNELVDAFPVEVVRKESGVWQQLYIGGGDDNAFNETWEKVDVATEEFLDRFKPNMIDGLRLPVNLNSVKWIEGLAEWFKKGYIVTIDYGGSTSEIQRQQPIRGYIASNRGLREESLLSKKITGLTDMTADVDFEVLIKAGELAGLTTVGYTNQNQLIHNLGYDYTDPFVWYLRSNIHHFREIGAPGKPMADYLREGMLQSMGNFKVLIQSKGVSNAAEISGLKDGEKQQEIKRILGL